jgi:hypothetical protein
MTSADAVVYVAVAIIGGAGLVAVITRRATLRGGREVRGKEAVLVGAILLLAAGVIYWVAGR